ncbi:DUF2505 family protein [Streptomyces roseifaciens]|uniref:DUF2505 family protein n=1 Tax=Streptomyces roseifaciens TaxID=1488406 RepID=UPI000717FE15|nr:DUF2505 family protein [Streptomyces roseifaciens]
MGKFTTTHDLRGAAPEAWALLLDDAFMEEVYLQDLGYPEWKVTQRTEGPEQTTRKVMMEPRRELPVPVAKVLGAGYRDAEESTFSTPTRTWSWKRVPSTLADKLRQGGTVRVEEAGADLSKLVMSTEIEAKVFGVGGLIESTFEKVYREEAERIAASLSKRLAAAKG